MPSDQFFRQNLEKCQTQLSDYKQRLEDADGQTQAKIKLAVGAADREKAKLAQDMASSLAKDKAKLKQEQDENLEKLKANMKQEEAAAVEKKSGEATKIADAKLSKGKRDEAIAKEALKKAMNLSDAEKQEMAQNKNLAHELGEQKTKTLLQKKEKMSYESELKENKIVDKARLKKQKNKVEALETQEINDSAKKAKAQEGEGDAQAMQKKLIQSAQHLAIGMSFKNKEIKQLKKTIEKHLGKHELYKKDIRKLMKDKNKANAKFGKCQKDSATKLRKARHKYNSSVDKLKDSLNTHLTQSELAKRALQLCEAKERGSLGREQTRVARRENRAVRRAKRKVGEKSNEKEEAKAIAKKVEKLTDKEMSPKCKTCLKLNEA